MMNRFLSLILIILSSFFSSFLFAQMDQKEIIGHTFWQWKLPSDSYDIHYIERGEGPRHVMLLHGFAAHSYTWRFVIDHLAQAGYHVWSMDLIGSGRSDKPPNAPYGMRLFTQQIEAFMQAKQIDKASIVGNSMGGGLALAMAVMHPKRVESLVLIDALAFPLKLPFYLVVTRTLGKLSKPLMGRLMVKQILKQIINDQNKISEEQIEAYHFPLQTPGGKDAFIKTLQNFNPQELENLALHYKEIQVPILIIWGEKDTWIPLKYFQRLSQVFPKATTVVIPNCGHAPQEECPAEVNKALLQFLKRIKA